LKEFIHLNKLEQQKVRYENQRKLVKIKEFEEARFNNPKHVTKLVRCKMTKNEPTKPCKFSIGELIS
jgi:hypothetical protein